MRAPDWRLMALGLFGLALLAAQVAPREPTGPAAPAVAQLAATPLAVAQPTQRSNIPSLPRPPAVHPLAHLGDDALRRLVVEKPAGLGSLSLGRPERGALLNAIPLGADPAWRLVDPSKSWGTEETVATLSSVIHRVTMNIDGTPPIYVGDISRQSGGHLRPHRSHQSGRDVDLGYYYSKSEKWYARATPQNLDRRRTWALVKELVDSDLVELIFMDVRVQHWLVEYAAQNGVEHAYLDRVFQNNRVKKLGLVRHTRGHLTHMHVRFKSPVARESGWRAHAELVRLGRIPKRLPRAALL